MDITYLGFNGIELGLDVDEWERSYIHHVVLEKVEIAASIKNERVIEDLEETEEITLVNTDFWIVRDMLEKGEIDSGDLVDLMDKIAA